MSDNIDSKSLASLASLKSDARPSANTPDARTRHAVANSTRRASFDGFLNTFLGNAPSERAGSAGKSRAKGPGTSPGSGLKPSDKESLKKSMDKTVEGEAGPAEDGELPADEEIAAAAEEAAVLIWNLIYGYGGGAALPGSASDSLKQLATMLNAQSSLTGQPGLAAEAVQDAIETANASAEMNSAAILESVDELLEGMPRQALDEALSRMAGKLGLPANGFEGVLAMLRGQITGINTMSRQSLMGMLSATANPAITAESAAGAGETATLDELLTDFLAEKKITLTGNENAEELANDFSKWLKNNGKSNNQNELARDAENAPQNAVDTNTEKNQTFQDILKTLENALQSTQQGALAQPAAQHPGQTATVQTAQAESVSTMLERMENIERMSEAMKAASKGGVNNITMQLAPAELGRVFLKVESRNGVVSARLKVEKKEAARELGSSLHELKNSLKALGIELGEVDIEHDPADNPADLLDELAKSDELNFFA